MENIKSKNPNEYLKTKVMTASPEELQLMLYDGVIRFCEQARLAIEKREIENSFNLLSRAEKIILELYVSMREEYAPDICANLKRLYMFCYSCLVEANIKKSAAKVDEALKVLRHLRESWALLIEKVKAEQAAQSGSPAASAAPIPAKRHSPKLDMSLIPDIAEEVGARFNIEG